MALVGADTQPNNRENRDRGRPRNGPSQREPHNVALTTRPSQRGPHNAALTTWFFLSIFSDEYRGFHGFTVFMVFALLARLAPPASCAAC